VCRNQHSDKPSGFQILEYRQEMHKTQSRVHKIPKNIEEHLKILSSGRMIIKSHTEDPYLLGATIKN